MKRWGWLGCYVAIADGGSGVWELFDELLVPTRHRKVVQVFDFYHATSHVWAAGKVSGDCAG